VGRRLLKVNEAIKEVLSTAIGSEMLDPRVGFVTVTGVETSSDLRHAKVFVSVMGNEGQRAATLLALATSHGFLQARVAGSLRLKRTPQLEFVYDETIDRGMRITQLMDRWAQESPPDEASATTDAGDETRPAADDVGGKGER
jgi:ribosome-binding factor A